MAASKADVYLSSEASEAAQTSKVDLPLFASELVCVIAHSRRALIQIEAEPRPLIPQRALQPGEQYRFHFDMAKCIGCKCCVVACNEQNGNPAPINWRRVGELAGGHYPNVQHSRLTASSA